MKWFLKIVFALASIGLLVYLAVPSPDFPDQPPDSVRSNEPWDSKTDQLRGYYTNYTREEVQDFYRSQFMLPFGLNYLSVRLIHPPEEADSFVRNLIQTTHLVEIVHPLRSSIYINEFITEPDKGDNWFKGAFFSQKITVKIVQSTLLVRIVVGVMIIVLGWFLLTEWAKLIVELARNLPRLKYIFKD